MLKKTASTFRFLLFRGLLLFSLGFIIYAAFDFYSEVSTQRHAVYFDSQYYNNVMAFDRVVALTFDDGPDPVMTEKIIAVLNKHQVPATFFFLGTQALKYPGLVQKAADNGFEIGNHSYTHSHQVHHDPTRIQYELDVTDKIIHNITGQSTLLYRPPYLLDIGSDPVPDPQGYPQPLDWVMQKGYIPVGADIDSLDWAAKTPDDIVANVLNNLDNGHLVLLHDGGQGKFTVEALDKLIPLLKARNYRFETVSSVIGLHAAAAMSPTHRLEPGSTDIATQGDVTRLQTFLLREGYYWDEPSGAFDSQTLSALKQWQKDQNIDESGRAGALTLSAIQRQLSLTQTQALATKVHLIFNQAVERQIQHNFMTLTSITRNNLPGIVKLVFGLVIFRLLFTSLLFIYASVRSQPKGKVWKGGVSVIIPAYNEAENIGATVDSMLKSHRKRLEIIVVDDGSTDQTREVVAEIIDHHPEAKIRLLTQANSGKAAALNHGLKKARYPVVVTVDGDTIFTPQTISHLVRPLGDRHISAVAGQVRVTHTKNILSIFQHLEYVISQNIEKTALSSINSIGVIPGPVGAWRKAELLAIGGFTDQTLVEDQDMTLKVLNYGKRIVYEPRAVAYTETPFSLKDFTKQRVRWVFGSIQCLFKYSKYLFNPFAGSLGLVVLPNTLIYSVLLPLLYPLMDLLFIGLIITNPFNQLWVLFVIFILIDFVYALAGFAREKTRKHLLLWFPLQRVFYRFILWYVVAKSLAKAIEGSGMLWNKVVKRGEATQLHLHLAENLATT